MLDRVMSRRVAISVLVCALSVASAFPAWAEPVHGPGATTIEHNVVAFVAAVLDWLSPDLTTVSQKTRGCMDPNGGCPESNQLADPEISLERFAGSDRSESGDLMAPRK